MTEGFDLAEFRRTGVQLVKDFFEPELSERFAALGRKVGEDARSGKVTRSAQFAGGVGIEDDSLIADSARLHETAKQILGEDVCWLTIRILMKDRSFNGPIEAHQDWPYFGGDTRKLNVFVPLTRCRPQNGMLVFYEGSHRVGPVERGAIDVERYPQFTAAAPSLDVGDVLFADFLTWHSSVPAIEDEDRIMLQVVLQPASDRSANNLYGKGWQDLGPLNPYRTTPMLNAVPSVSVLQARHMLASGKVDEADRMSRGLREDSALNVEAHLLAYDIATGRGEDGCEHLAAAQKALEILQARVAELASAPRAWDARPATDDVAAAQIDHLKAELAALHASTSWKLTAPLRWLRRGRTVSAG